jgi:hypothetical protein
VAKAEFYASLIVALVGRCTFGYVGTSAHTIARMSPFFLRRNRFVGIESSTSEELV